MLSLSKKLSLTTQPIYRFVNEHSVDFDGVDDRIITDGEVVQYEHATYSFWCKSSETGFNAGVFGHGADRQGAFHFNFISNRPLLFLGNNYYVYWNDTPAQDDGEWHHWVVYVCKSDITKSKLWVDAVLQTVNDTNTNSQAADYTETLTIGSQQQAGGHSFKGRIDEFAVYDRELTQAEVSKIYNSGKPINLNLNAGAYQSANPLITSTKSMEFDGLDDFLELGSQSGNLRLANESGSISAWVKPTLSGDSFQRIVDKSDGSNAQNGYAMLVHTTGVIQTNINNSIIMNSTTTLVSDKWQHVVWTWNGTNHKIYISGLLSDTVSNTTTPPSATTNMRIGSWNHSTAREYKGKMTEVGIYNRCLTALEVASLYNQGMPTNLLVNRNDYQSGNPTVFNTKQVDFDGTDDYLKANSTLGSMTGSISMWFKKNTDAGGQYFIDLRGSGSGTGYIVAFSQSFISVSSGTLYINGVVGNSPSTGIWNHLVVTGITLNIDECINIGRRYSNTEFFNGEMSQVGLWNSTLTADEVSSLYNHGLPIDLNTDQAAYESSSNLVGYWRMGSGTLDTYPLIADQTNATLGSELVTNGNFATDSDWTKQTGWSISNGQAIHTGSGSYLSQDILQVNTLYKVNISIAEADNSNFVQIYMGNSPASVIIQTTGDFTYYFTSQSSLTLGFALRATGDVKIDNVSVKQVNGNPAIMTNQTASDIENGSPYANLIQNTNFTDSSEWSVAGWNITDNQAVLTGTGVGNNLFIGHILELNKTYNIVVDAEISAGSFTVMLGGGGDGYSTVGTITSTGIHTVTGKNISTTSNTLLLQSQSGSTPSSLKINSVTLAEVNTGLQGYWKMGDGTNDEYPVIYDQTDPTLGSEEIVNGDFSSSDISMISGAGTRSVANNELKIEESGTNFSQVIYNGILDTSKIYKATFDLTIGTGAYDIYDTTQGTQTIPSSGTYTYYLQNTARFYVGSNGAGDVWYMDNISVKEVQGNPATMTNMVEGNITNIHPLTKIRNYYRMGDGILDGFPIIQDQTSPNLAHIPTTNLITYSEDFTQSAWTKTGTTTVSATNLTSPTGTTNATRITGLTGAGSNDLRFNTTTNPASKTYTGSVYLKGSGTLRLMLSNDVDNAGSTPITLTSDWVRHNFTFGFNSTSGILTITLDDVSGTATQYDIWGVQLEEQSQATAYIKSDGIAAVRKSSTTNLLNYSEDFSNAFYQKIRSSVTANQIISPDGTQNADKFIEDSSNNTHLLWTQDITVTVGDVITWSVYAKKGERSWIFLRDTQAGSFTGLFDLENGVTGNKIGSLASNIVDAGNGWYRCSITYTSTTTTARGRIYISTDDNTNPYQGDGTSGVYIWGSQLELQTQAETYAKTTGLPVTIDLFTENNYGTMTNMSASDIVEDTP